MPDNVRPQVRAANPYKSWEDVGHNPDNERMPVQIYDKDGNPIDSELIGNQRAIIVKDVGGGSSGDQATETTLFDVKWALERLYSFFNRLLVNGFNALNVRVANDSSDPVIAQVDTVGELTKLKSINDIDGFEFFRNQNRLTALKYYEMLGV